MRHYMTAAAAAAAMALVVTPATASADNGDGHDGEPITTIATGLDGPRQLSDYRGDRLVVAESDSGEVSSVDLDSGEVETLLTGLGIAQGVDYEDGRLYVAVGEGPPGEGAAPPADVPRAVVIEAEPGGDIIRSFDLLQFELDNNPDGQVQFVNGAPVDALSNPFSVLAQDERLLVSDAGANVVLSIDLDDGEISEFFVPEVITDTPECANAQNNPGTTGCDPVPTEITEGPDGRLYVGSLAAESPGAARVYVLDQDGKQVDVIKGLTSITGVAVDRHGTVYAADLLEGAPEEMPPPAGFDPATVGELTRIDDDGDRSTAQVTMPTGLEIEDGELYASAWSIAGFLGLTGRGEVQRIDDDAFTE